MPPDAERTIGQARAPTSGAGTSGRAPLIAWLLWALSLTALIDLERKRSPEVS